MLTLYPTQAATLLIQFLSHTGYYTDVAFMISPVLGTVMMLCATFAIALQFNCAMVLPKYLK
jgi:hypothetical protein